MSSISTSRPVLSGSVWLGGALGAVAVTAFMYVAGRITGLALGEAVRFLGGILGFAPPSSPAAGGAVLTVMAFVWAFIFRQVHKGLAGSPIARGVIFGLLVWAASTAVLWPLLHALRPALPAPGLFAFGFGGWHAAIISALAHAVYGLILARTVAPAGA